MEGDSWEKLSLLLIVLGLVIGAIGGLAAFLLAMWFTGFFYLGFFMAILGFMIAVLHRIGKSEKRGEGAQSDE